MKQFLSILKAVKKLFSQGLALQIRRIRKARPYEEVKSWPLRRHIALGALLLILLLGPALFFLTRHPQSAEAAWFNSSWGFRSAIQIGNSSGSNLTDFQVSVNVGTSALVGAGKMKSDCSDIRITDQGGKLLPHWIEGPCNTAANSSVIWTKIPNIPTSGGTVYIYYGNPSATTTSSTANVFIREIPNVVGAWTFNEGTGTTALDYSGNNNTGTLGTGNSSPGWVTGNFGTGLSFGGLNNNVLVNDNDNLDGFSGISVFLWAKPTVSITAEIIIKHNTWEMYQSGVNIVGRINGSTGQCASTGSLFSLSSWHLIGMTWNGSQTKMYIDGVLNRTCDRVTTLPNSIGNLSIGSYESKSYPFTGQIDEPRIYNRALTQAEISDLYGTGSNRYGYVTTNYAGKELVRKWATANPTTTLATEEIGSGPVAYWKFDEGVGTSVYDSTSNRNTGTFGTGSSAPNWQTEDQCISGKCLKFDGTDDYVSVTDDSSLRFGNGSTDSPFSISAWVKLNNTGAKTVVAKYMDGGNKEWVFGIESNTYLQFYVQDQSAGAFRGRKNSTALNTNTWYHIAAVYDGGGLTSSTKLYLNGIQVDDTDITLGAYTAIEGSASPVKIGINRVSDLSSPFNGFIDEPKIYPYARTAAQIKSDYNSRGSSQGSSVILGSDATPESLSNGLVGYWKMDETTGTSTADFSGNGNTGTFGTGNSAPTWVGGMYGNGLSFDGGNDYVNSGDPANGLFDFGANNFSVSVWTKKTVDPAGWLNVIVNKWNSGASPGTNEWSLSYGYDTATSKKPGFAIESSNTIYSAASTEDLTTGQWYHLTGVRNNNYLYLYVNGVLKGSTYIGSISVNNVGRNLTIGNFGTILNHSYNGLIDEVRIYNRALSPSEVQTLYNYAPGPVGWWKMDEGVGSSAYDSSGNNNSGVWAGTGTHWTTGKFGKAGKFNGSDDWINQSSYSWPNIGQISVSAWFKTLSTTGPIFDKFLDGAAPGAVSLRLWSSGYLRTDIYTNGCTYPDNMTSLYVNTQSLNDGNWHYGSVTYDGSTLSLFIDGIKKNSASVTGNICNTYTGFSIGTMRRDAPINFFNGLIDDVKIYNYARTPGQIVQDLNAGHPLGGSPVSSQVAYWKLDEGYGTTIHNSGLIGSTANGTFGPSNSAPSWTNDGKFSKALTFVNDYVTIAKDPVYNLQEMSVTAWVKVDPADTSGPIAGNPNGYYYRYGLFVNAGVYEAWFRSTGGAWPLTSNTSYTAGSWDHIALTYNNGIAKIYVNGVLKNTSTFPYAPLGQTVEQFNIGTHYLPSGSTFGGSIDEVKIYSAALTADEILTDYNQGAGLVAGVSLLPSAGNTAPVAEWQMDEKTGTIINDSTGNGNSGSFGTGSSAPTWTVGKMGSALRFDGSNDYVNIGSNSSLQPTNTLTACAWIKTNDSSTYQMIVNNKDYDQWPGWQFAVNNSTLVFYNARTGTGDATSYASPANSISSNSWYYTCAVYSGSASAGNIVKLYINGILQSPTITYDNGGNLGYPLAKTALIGARWQTGNKEKFFSGLIDQVKIYNYARTPAQIAYDYNHGKPIGWWKLDECQGNIAFDATGVGNSGSINIGLSGTQTMLGTCGSANTAAAWSNGKTGKFASSLNFDGNDDYVNAGDITSFEFTSSSEFSLSAWVKPSDADEDGYIVGKNDDSPSQGYGLYWQGSTDKVALSMNVTSSGNTSDAVFTDTNTWVQVTAVFNNGNITYYRNGVVAGSLTGKSFTTPTSADLRIGNRTDGTAATTFFSGQIDDVRIYNYALTDQQVKAVYNENSAVRFGPSSE